MNVILVIAYEGYQQIEYGIPKKLLERESYGVITASDKLGSAIAKDGSTAEVDLLIDDISIKDCDGIFFIGGPGALEHLDNEASYMIIKNANEAGVPLGAICISPCILAKAGILTGKNATGWNGDNLLGEIYQKYGVNYIKQDVVVDGNIITASGPHAAERFGKEIIKLLQKQKD